MARRIKITADENSDKLKKPNDLEQADSGISKDPEQSSAPEDTKAPEETVCKGSEISDIDNARLIKALQQYDNEMLEQFFAKSDDEPPVSISSEGRRKMKDTLAPWLGADRAELLMEREEIASHNRIKAWRHKKRVQLAKWTARWSATAAVVLLMVMSGNFIGNNAMAFRVPQAGVVAEKKTDYSKFHINESEIESDSSLGDLDGKIGVQYVLTDVIEGFVLEDKIVTPGMSYYVYSNLDNQRYQFSQYIAEDDVAINTEENDFVVIDSSFGDAYYFEYGTSKSLVWNYNGYSFKLEGNISKDQLLSLQKSIRKEELRK